MEVGIALYAMAMIVMTNSILIGDGAVKQMVSFL